MSAEWSRLRSPAAVQLAMDEFAAIGRPAFLRKYGFGRSVDFLVRNPKNGQECDSKAIVGAAYGFQYPSEGPLSPKQFSGGLATVVPKLQSLGFEVIEIGQDWSQAEVDAAVASYFEMLWLESQQRSYNKAAANAALRAKLNKRTKGSVEQKHHNISAVLSSLDLPFIDGYKPKANVQLLLRKSIQQYVLNNAQQVKSIVDAYEESTTPSQKSFKAILVQPPPELQLVRATEQGPRIRLPRKVDFASRDEHNRKLGREGEQFVFDFEHKRLVDAGLAECVSQLDWVSDRLGDGAGYDILSADGPSTPRFIEVKTTNGGHATSFIISRNEVDFAREVGDQFFLYRVFQFRKAPSLYMLQGDVAKHAHLEALDYRASFQRLVA